MPHKKITLQKFLENHAWKIQQCLNIENWDFNITYQKHGWRVAKGISMEVKVNYTYLRIEMCYGDSCVKQWKRGWKNNMIDSLLHEFSHLYTNWVLDFVKRDKLFNHQFEFYTSLIDRMVKEKYWNYMEKYKINKNGIINK